MELHIKYGLTSTTFNINKNQLILTRRKVEPIAAGNVEGMVQAALEAPLQFPPLFRALTPDDQIAIVVDDELPTLTPLVAAVVDHLGQAGIRRGQITVVGRADIDRPDLDLAWPGIMVETHDPTNRDHLSYLATTKAGRRVYVNRTVVEADQIVVVAQARFGLSPARWLFPILSDHPHEIFDDRDSMKEEITEVCWLLGLPFFMQVIPGPGESVDRIMAGPADSFAEVKKALRDRWEIQVDRAADLVLATIRGQAETLSIADVARAAHHAARIVRDDGIIALMMEGQPAFDRGFEVIRDAGTIPAAIKKLNIEPNPDHEPARHWLNVVKKHRVLILSQWPDDVAEELFANAIPIVSSLTKFIADGRSVIYLPDAHRCRAEVLSQE